MYAEIRAQITGRVRNVLRRYLFVLFSDNRTRFCAERTEGNNKRENLKTIHMFDPVVTTIIVRDKKTSVCVMILYENVAYNNRKTLFFLYKHSFQKYKPINVFKIP